MPGRTIDAVSTDTKPAPGTSTATTDPAGTPIALPPLARHPADRYRPNRRARVAGTATRIRALAALIAVLTITVVVLLLLETNQERDGLRTIGDQAGPEVIATGDLYFALNDMDAQLANVLLVGQATDLGFTRSDALRIYEQRRQQADADIRQATAASTDPATAHTITTILDQLGRYEALTAQTILLDQQHPHPPGQPDPVTLDQYRQATDLLKTQLLPAARQLTDAHANALDAAYQVQQARIQTDRIWTLTTGVAVNGLLIALQVYLTRRFRRMVNPALAAATLLAVTGIVLANGLLSDEADHLHTAKKDAFDSVLALTQARAVSYDANADESRYLVDPQRAAQYQQAFLDKSQQLLTLPDATIDTYDNRLANAVTAYQADHTDVGWNGLYGTEFRNITFTGERAAAETTLLRYQVYQRDDRRIRTLATTGHLSDAIAFCTSYAPGQSNYAFDQYDNALAALITINTNAFHHATDEGSHELDGWTPGLLLAGAILPGLVLAGIWPRLAEYH